MNTDDEVTVPVAATLLKVNPETIRRNIQSHRLKATKRGIQWFIKRKDLASFRNAYNPQTGRHKD